MTSGVVSTWAEHTVDIDASLVLRHLTADSAVILPGARSGSAAGPTVAPLPEAEPQPQTAGAGEASDKLAAEAVEAEADPFGFRHLLAEPEEVPADDLRGAPEQPGEPDPGPGPDPQPGPDPGPDHGPDPLLINGGLIDDVPGGSFDATPSPDLGAFAPSGPPLGAGAPRAESAIPDLASRPSVQAVLCDLGHANPVLARACRSCHHPLIDQTTRDVPRPSLGRLVFNDGLVVGLERPALIGRAPAASMAHSQLSETPQLIALASEDKRISRLHVEVRLEGWQVYVLDSSSLNGTMVAQPGLPPRHLQSGEPCLATPAARSTWAAQ